MAILELLILNGGVVAPEYGKLFDISFHVFPLSELICHWYKRPEPIAEIVNPALFGLTTVRLVGCEITAGGVQITSL